MSVSLIIWWLKLFWTIFTKFDEVDKWLPCQNIQHFVRQESIFVLFACRDDWKAALPGPSVASLKAKTTISSSGQCLEKKIINYNFNTILKRCSNANNLFENEWVYHISLFLSYTLKNVSILKACLGLLHHIIRKRDYIFTFHCYFHGVFSESKMFKCMTGVSFNKHILGIYIYLLYRFHKNKSNMERRNNKNPISSGHK